MSLMGVCLETMCFYPLLPLVMWPVLYFSLLNKRLLNDNITFSMCQDFFGEFSCSPRLCSIYSYVFTAAAQYKLGGSPISFFNMI